MGFNFDINDALEHKKNRPIIIRSFIVVGVFVGVGLVYLLMNGKHNKLPGGIETNIPASDTSSKIETTTVINNTDNRKSINEYHYDNNDPQPFLDLVLINNEPNPVLERTLTPNSFQLSIKVSNLGNAPAYYMQDTRVFIFYAEKSKDRNHYKVWDSVQNYSIPINESKTLPPTATLPILISIQNTGVQPSSATLYLYFKMKYSDRKGLVKGDIHKIFIIDTNRIGQTTSEVDNFFYSEIKKTLINNKYW